MDEGRPSEAEAGSESHDGQDDGRQRGTVRFSSIRLALGLIEFPLF
jgi:hypothetical protein